MESLVTKFLTLLREVLSMLLQDYCYLIIHLEVNVPTPQRNNSEYAYEPKYINDGYLLSVTAIDYGLGGYSQNCTRIIIVQLSLHVLR